MPGIFTKCEICSDWKRNKKTDVPAWNTSIDHTAIFLPRHQHSGWNTKENNSFKLTFKSLRPEGLRLELIITCMSSTSSSPSGLGLVTSSATSFAASSNYEGKNTVTIEQFQFSVSLWYNFSQSVKYKYWTGKTTWLLTKGSVSVGNLLSFSAKLSS